MGWNCWSDHLRSGIHSGHSVMIMGFETKMALQQQLLFSIIGAVVGISITWMLRGQGIAFAKEEPESKAVMAAYHKAINKTKKIRQLHTITWHVVVRSTVDIFSKVATVAGSTYFMLYVFMEGSGDYGLLGLAVANLSMFISFGILAMARAYDFYIVEHLAAIKERTDQMGLYHRKETRMPMYDDLGTKFLTLPEQVNKNKKDIKAIQDAGIAVEPAGDPGDIQFNEDDALGASDNLHWDIVNERLGVGTNEPSEKLHVVGNIKTEEQIIINKSAEAGREVLFKARVEDAGNDQFGIANGTSAAGVFAPAFYGASAGPYAMVFRGLVAASDDQPVADISIMGLSTLRLIEHQIQPILITALGHGLKTARYSALSMGPEPVAHIRCKSMPMIVLRCPVMSR